MTPRKTIGPSAGKAPIPQRHRPGVVKTKLYIYTGVGGWENSTVASKEMNLNEKSLAGADQLYVYLGWTRISPYRPA